jgi:hypothetical protein
LTEGKKSAAAKATADFNKKDLLPTLEQVFFVFVVFMVRKPPLGVVG